MSAGVAEPAVAAANLAVVEQHVGAVAEEVAGAGAVAAAAAAAAG